MKLNPIPLMAALCLFLCPLLSAQVNTSFELHLKSGKFIPVADVSAARLSEINTNARSVDDKKFLIIQFEQIPTPAQRANLLKEGIQLLEYIPNNAYTATITGELSASLIQQYKVRSIVEPSARQKMEPGLATGRISSWANRSAGNVSIRISFPQSYTAQNVIAELRKRNIIILADEYSRYRILTVELPAARLVELATLPFIEYLEPAAPADQVLNENARSIGRAESVNAPVSAGGLGLDGDGVVIGVGDNGDITSHIDFNARVINRSAHIMRAHASHVTGTALGGGIVSEWCKGFAPKAKVVSQLFSNILLYSPEYVQDYGMVITNNSYGSIASDCYYVGLYDLTSRILDQQAFDMPELQHVFAGGNDGTQSCFMYGPGFKTVLGGYQSAKNVLTVGSTDFKGALSSFTSRGPVNDGRLKPEITSQGTLVWSPWVNNIYSSNNGTSMAAPGISGGLALMVQRYRQLHSGSNPQASLMKAVICNSANDLGNTGLDFSYGLGSMNLSRAMNILNNNYYYTSSLTPVSNSHSQVINIPPNTSQVKILLYWPDPPASVMAAKTLVNDLDLHIADPSSGLHFPAVLDTTANQLNTPATSGVDHTNNIEQVVINNPAPGNYTILVNGVVNQNPSQNFYIVYDLVQEGLVLNNPVNGGAYNPRTSIYDSMSIHWEAYGGPANTFTLEYTLDDGATWTTINNSIAANQRYLRWATPDVPTDLARIRISRNGTVLTQTSGRFTILRPPVLTINPANQCEGSITLDWATIPGANDYEVMMLRGPEMLPVAIVPGLTYTINGLSKDSIYWVSVRPRINGIAGRRATALSRQPNAGPCTSPMYDHDLKLDSIITAKTGRLFTSTALSASTTISARIKNLDDQTANSGFSMKYSVNGGAWITEPVAASITGGGIYQHDFATTQDFSAIGNYTLRIVVENIAADPFHQNDTLVTTIRQLNNLPVDVTGTFSDGFETAAFDEVTRGMMGLPGIERYDFSNSSSFGRARPFINSGISFEGTKALTLDATINIDPSNTNYLDGTYNLATYSAGVNNLRLDFQFKQHQQLLHPDNKVWIRGNETLPWIEVYDLFDNQASPGIFRRSASIELSRWLSDNAQDFSTGFQVRWGQHGGKQTTGNDGGAGYTFDAIRLYEVFNDLSLQRIDTPAAITCGLTSSVPVRITVRNTTNSTVTNVPVQFSVDGGPFYPAEQIPVIAGNSSQTFTFTASGADLSLAGTHTIVAVVSYPGDSFSGNDTISTEVYNLPLINSFPYLQDFESGAGSWFAGGTRSSWELGSPISPRIKSAASGVNAWKTSITSYYNDLELSYLYSPCFDISTMSAPTLSFSLSLNIEDCGLTLCDAAWMEYSTDGGITWNKLGSQGQGTNWYNKNYSGNHVWSQQNYTRWHVATTALPAGFSNLRLRFVFDSDDGVNIDGIAIDDIHIYDNTQGIYDGGTMGAPVTQTITGGTNWVDFTSGGQLIASIQPNNQAMGTTAVQAFIHAGPARSYGTQYYHNRNITIQPPVGMENLADSAIVRFYFLDSETELLLNATGCGSCFKPTSAYRLGVSKYSDPLNANEDGNVTNSVGNYWSFIQASNARKVPFDKGYYAEFKVKEFSEFWLNNGGFTNNQSLPVQLTTFTATRSGDKKDALLNWTTTSEIDLNRFEIEMAAGNEALQQSRFDKIGEVSSSGSASGNQSYAFADIAPNKTGVRYYRLKMIDQDGSIQYSAIRPVVFTDDITWQVYPNPSSGQFNLVYQVNDGTRIYARIIDTRGAIVYQENRIGSGYEQKWIIDLESNVFAQGLYMLEITAGERKELFRLLKH